MEKQKVVFLYLKWMRILIGPIIYQEKFGIEDVDLDEVFIQLSSMERKV